MTGGASGSRRAEEDRAPAPRAHERHVEAPRVRRRVRGRDDLDVGHRLLGPGPDEGPRADAGARERPRPVAAVVASGLLPLRRREAERLLRLPGDRHPRVVLEVLPHAGEVAHHRDPQRAEVLGGAHAGEHQELRRPDRPRAQDDLASRPCLALGAALPVGDSHRSAVLDEHPGRERVALDGEVLPVEGRTQVGVGGAVPLAVPLVEGVEGGAVLGLAVEVVVPAEPGLLGGGEERERERRHPPRVGHVLGPARAVERGRPPLVVLGLLEPGQDAGPAPAGVARPPPRRRSPRGAPARTRSR